MAHYRRLAICFSLVASRGLGAYFFLGRCQANSMTMLYDLEKVGRGRGLPPGLSSLLIFFMLGQAFLESCCASAAIDFSGGYQDMTLLFFFNF